MSEKVKEGYRRMYSGVFFKKYILGLWVMAEGIVYDMFDEEVHVISDDKLPKKFDRLFVGGDYGMSNATAFVLVGQLGDDFYIIREYYYGVGKKKGKSDEEIEAQQKTVGEYCDDFSLFLGSDQPEIIFLESFCISADHRVKETRIQKYSRCRK